VDCKNKIDTSNKRSISNPLSITQKVLEQRINKALNEGPAGNSHIEELHTYLGKKQCKSTKR